MHPYEWSRIPTDQSRANMISRRMNVRRDPKLCALLAVLMAARTFGIPARNHVSPLSVAAAGNFIIK